MKPLLRFSALLMALLMLAQACTTSKTIRVMKPADIDVKKDIKKVVLVNRYKAKGGNAWISTLEAFFSGEMLWADRKGAEQALSGLLNGLQGSERYEVVMANTQLIGNGLGFFPEPLTVAQIQSLCTQYNADAVIALEAFDSDVNIKTEPKTRTETRNGKQVVISYVQATENVNLTMGWRLYEKEKGAIIDQHQLYKNMFFTAEGNNTPQAISRLVFPVDAVSRTAAEGGNVYALRIAPAWVLTTREFYGSGSRGLRRAKQMAKRDDWENAAIEWKSLTKSDRKKVAKRATYNMAIASEMMGKYDLALTWARKAADIYGSRKANNYIGVIKQRMYNDQRAADQLAPAAADSTSN